jgi:NADH:ubiquinone oxidoreductase subunit 2 (subunit N)
MTEPSTKTIYVDSSLNNTLDTIFLYCILDNKLYMRILITLFILIGQIIINIYYYLIEKDTKEDVHDAAINVVLFLIATYSLILMLQVKNLIMLFLCLELQSLIVCILCSSKGKLLNIESSLKLYITGATSTGFLLMGSGLLYGATGSIDLEEIFMFLNYSNILADINYKIDLYHS